MRYAGWIGWLAVACLGWGCASSSVSPADEVSTPVPKPAVQPVPPEPETPPEPRPAPPEVEDEVSGRYGPQTVVIDEPEQEEERPQTLAETARLARQRRAEQEGTPVAVITDETLPEYAVGELSTAADTPGSAPANSAEKTAEAPESEEEERGEDYWRTTVREARILWRDLVQEVIDLEVEAAELRQRFYSEDDGFYRDSQIKPAWDRALDRLGEVRVEVGRAQERLQEILAGGRIAGALPGWLREGIEYEPAPEEPEEGPGIHEATEPDVIDIDDGGRS